MRLEVDDGLSSGSTVSSVSMRCGVDGSSSSFTICLSAEANDMLCNVEDLERLGRLGRLGRLKLGRMLDEVLFLVGSRLESIGSCSS